MKWTDPNIKLIAAGSSDLRRRLDWIGWNRTVLNFLKRHADYFSLHMYVGNAQNNFGEFMTSSVDAATTASRPPKALSTPHFPASRATAKSISPGMSGTSGTGPRQQCTRPQDTGRALQPGRRAGGGDVPQHLRQQFAHRQDRQYGANGECDRADIHERKGIVPSNYLLSAALFANNSKGKALDLFVDSPKYMSPRLGEVPYLDMSSAYDNGTLVVNVVNRHKDQPIEAEFEAEDKQFSGAVDIRRG